MLHHVLSLLALAVSGAAAAPHILWIVADDLGFNDVSLHGSLQIPTPNIDAIAQNGALLNNYYVQPVCSPSRSTFLSGRHVIHTGIYMPFDGNNNLRLHLNYSLLPAYLKAVANYSTHLVGKWHIGQNAVAAIPVSRGFDTALGYLAGAQDYYAHTDGSGRVAYDFMDEVGGSPPTLSPAVEYNGTYSLDVFVARAKEIIAGAATATQPMFLYLAFQNVHWPLEAPQVYVDRFANATNGSIPRQMVCAMAAALDDAVGNITAALKQAGIYDDTIIAFTSDNGGDENLDEGSWSSNFPLRGGKNTLWQGGTRVYAAIQGPGIVGPGAVLDGMMHASDWLPTLVTAASGGQDWRNFIPAGEPDYLLGDGMSVWPMLTNGSASPRYWVLLETHPAGATDRVHGDAIVVGDWKLIKWAKSAMPQVENGWFPPPGADPSWVYSVKCGPPPLPVDPTACSTSWCLFNVTADPCEYNDVSAVYPDVVTNLQAQLATFQATAVPPVVGVGCDPKIYVLPDGIQTWWPCDAPAPTGGVLLRADETLVTAA